MSKKVALLVTTTLATRVIVEVDDNFNENAVGDLWYGDDSPLKEPIANAVATQAAEHYIDSIDCGIYENIDSVVNDTEMPYDENYDK